MLGMVVVEVSGVIKLEGGNKGRKEWIKTFRVYQSRIIRRSVVVIQVCLSVGN